VKADVETPTLMRGRVLICAGSDSGGGAGIQADIKAVTALGGFASTALTALTAQNTLGVHGIHEVPLDFVDQQIRVVLDDIGADCVKTGMLHGEGVIRTVIAALDAAARGVPLVVDPVMVAKGGHKLLDPAALGALRDEMLPRASLVTPNIPEAELLTGMEIHDVHGMRRAADRLLTLGPDAVLLKGGHMDGDELTDLLVTPEGCQAFTGPRLTTRHTHGTGCSMASATAAGIAQGLELSQAVARARDYVHLAILTAPGFGAGHGPLNHAHTVRAEA
jgi:hydroxymethylpyrimidine/phosphomethylpyrimidine kinase